MRPILALTAVLAAGVAGAAEPTFPSSAGNITVETIAGGLAHPWSLAFLPDGRMLVTERPGRLRIVTRNGQLSSSLGGVPAVFAQSQAGLMDVVLTRDFERSRTVFVCYAEPADGGGRIAVLPRAAARWRNTTARFTDDNIPAKRPGLARPQSSAAASCTHRTAICSSPSAIISARVRWRRISTTISARLSASRPTARRRPTIPSSDSKMRCRRSGPMACAMPRGSPSIQPTGSYGSRNMAPWVATRSTSSRKAKTTDGRWSAMAATTMARRSARARPRWTVSPSSRSGIGHRRSRRPA